MPISKPSARKLATQLEWSLLESSYAPMLKDITVGRLRQKITRARTFHDKYRALARQQRGEARGKRQPKGTRPSEGNDRTVQKQTLFAEARERFELQLEKLEEREKRANAKTGQAKSSKAKTAVVKSGRAKAPVAKSGKAKTAAVKTGQAKSAKPSMPAASIMTAVSITHTDTGKQEQVATGMVAKRAELEARKAARQAESERSLFARTQGKLERTGATAHLAHAGSRGRRQQARRDSR